MKYVRVLIVRHHDKALQWKDIGWGKHYIDEVRKEGNIVMLFVHQN
ncbi:MAG: hypothetical protein RLZZ196_1076 [Bacteroidota bacterium]|jgi:hypothetical protein